MMHKILPGKGDTKGYMSPLILFDMIVDADVGLLATIMKSYLDPKVFKEDFFKDLTVMDLVNILYTRKMENPLYLCINDDYKDSCDSLYEELMRDKYNDILELSVKTEFYRLIGFFNGQSEIDTTIVCERQEEIDLLKGEDITKDNRIILSKDLSVDDISKCNQFYFKYIQSVNKYIKYMLDKSVYFANYKFNRILIDEFSDPTLILLAENNVLNIIDIFNTKIIGGNNDV